MNSKTRWILSGAVALLLVVGGAGLFVAAGSAPMTHEENLRVHEEKFGKATPMPTVEVLKEQLAQVEAQATAQDDPQKVQDDWEQRELLRQQLDFAALAPSPMPTGHTSVSVTGGSPSPSPSPSK